MNQFTFWNENDTKEHVTLQFIVDGSVWRLTRDRVKSVSEEWEVVGDWQTSPNGFKFVKFHKDFNYSWVAVTQLARNGWTTCGAGYVAFEAKVTSRATQRVTDPETLMGRKRRRSLDLGVRSAAAGACDTVAQMRAAIVARNSKG